MFGFWSKDFSGYSRSKIVIKPIKVCFLFISAFHTNSWLIFLVISNKT